MKKLLWQEWIVVGYLFLVVLCVGMLGYGEYVLPAKPSASEAAPSVEPTIAKLNQLSAEVQDLKVKMENVRGYGDRKPIAVGDEVQFSQLQGKQWVGTIRADDNGTATFTADSPMDVPAIPGKPDHVCVKWYSITTGDGPSCEKYEDSPTFTCKDKSRILLADERGVRHCIKFPKDGWWGRTKE